MKQTIPVLLFLIIVTTTVHAQLLPPIPPGVTPLPDPIYFPSPVNRSLNTFNSITGELMVGTVVVTDSTEFRGEIFNNVVLNVADDGHFNLVSFYQPPPPPPELVCTEEEVLSAIPALSLELDVVEATDLIGCLPKYSGFRTDLEEGKTVFVGWVGADGQINPASGYTTPNPALNFGFQVFSPRNIGIRPAITFHLLEGIVTRYSYSVPNESSNCEEKRLSDNFESVQLGQSYDQVKLLFGCNGKLLTTTIDAESIEEQYTWDYPNYGRTVLPFYFPFSPSVPSNSENIDIAFLNGEVASLTYSSNEYFSVSVSCTATELSNSFETIQEGDSELQILDSISCPPKSRRVSFREGVKVVSYNWASDDYSPSALISVNRSINVTITDGVATNVQLRRS